MDGSHVWWRAGVGPRPEVSRPRVASGPSDESTLRSGACSWHRGPRCCWCSHAGCAVVHRSLRPLVEVERMAAAIAAGELIAAALCRNVIHAPRSVGFARASTVRWRRSSGGRVVGPVREQARSSESCGCARFITDAITNHGTPPGLTIRGR